MTSASPTKTQGVYRIRHKKTKQFYIGSSKNCELRFYQHDRRFLTGKQVRQLQAVNDQDGNHWEYTVIEVVKNTGDLEDRETVHVSRNITNPLCLNMRPDTKAPLRGHKRTVKDGNNHARALVGKNLKHPAHAREAVVTLVSPEGKVYKHVRSINRFAKQHGLSQGSLNQVAQGVITHYKGWRLPTTPVELTYSKLGNINVTVVDPAGKEHTVKNLAKFCRKTGATYNSLYNQITIPNRRYQRPSAQTDKYGRDWYVKGVITPYTITDTWTGEEWHNIVVVSVFEETFGLRKGVLRRLIAGDGKMAGKRYTIRPMEDSQ